MKETKVDIRELYRKLVYKYEDGPYVSRASVFANALRDGTITKDIFNKAKAYYGSLWNYVGD